MKEYTVELSGYRIYTTTVKVNAENLDDAIDAAFAQIEYSDTEWNLASPMMQDVQVDEVSPNDEDEE